MPNAECRMTPFGIRNLKFGIWYLPCLLTRMVSRGTGRSGNTGIAMENGHDCFALNTLIAYEHIEIRQRVGGGGIGCGWFGSSDSEFG